MRRLVAECLLIGCYLVATARTVGSRVHGGAAIARILDRTLSRVRFYRAGIVRSLQFLLTTLFENCITGVGLDTIIQFDREARTRN
jgi:hypothetical protein